jgi:hypothetical protein
MEHDRNSLCQKEFDEIKARLDAGNSKFEAHGEKLVELETNFTHLINSMNVLTKSLWGVATSIGLTLVGFLIWYIQNIRK